MKPRMSLEETAELLELAEELNQTWQYRMLADLLEPLEEELLLAEPELGVCLCVALNELGEADRVAGLMPKLIASCARVGNTRASRRRANLEGLLQYNRGELKLAYATFEQLLSDSTAAGDLRFSAIAEMHLGVVAGTARHFETALRHHRRSLVSSEKSGDRLQVACCYHNEGLAYRELGKPLEADAAFVAALQLASEACNQPLIATSEMERAVLMIATDNLRLAEMTSLRAFARAELIKDARVTCGALHVRGKVAFALARYGACRALLLKGAALARELGNPVLLGEIYEDLALAEFALGSSTSGEEYKRQAGHLLQNAGVRVDQFSVQAGSQLVLD